MKHHVPVRGDRILWGKLLSGEMRKKKRDQGLKGAEKGNDPEGSGLEIVPEGDQIEE